MRKNKDVYFDGGLQGWIKNTARKEHWRWRAHRHIANNWYGVDDLIQDGYICYCRCRDRYTLAPPEPGHQDLNTDTPTPQQYRHFMALVQRTFYNHIITLSSKLVLSQELTMSELGGVNVEGETFDVEALLPPQPEETSALVVVLQAPTEIGEAIVKLVNDGVDGGKYLRSKLRIHNGRVTRGRRTLRETTTQRLTRILDGNGELLEMTKNYLLS